MPNNILKKIYTTDDLSGINAPIIHLNIFY